jgi:hypothetical protein
MEEQIILWLFTSELKILHQVEKNSKKIQSLK